MTITIQREALDGAVKWVNTVDAQTAYRTEMSRGSAAQVAYTGVSATSTFTTDLSAIPNYWVSRTP